MSAYRRHARNWYVCVCRTYDARARARATLVFNSTEYVCRGARMYACTRAHGRTGDFCVRVRAEMRVPTRISNYMNSLMLSPYGAADG